MRANENLQRTLLERAVHPHLRRWVDGFLIAKRARHTSPRTIAFYRARLAQFADFCQRHNVATLDAVDPSLLREFLLHLEAQGHNPGGVHTFYRVLKTFLRWYERETEPDGWRNPIRKVEPPKVPEQILEPVELRDVARMLAACNARLVGLRDRAILLTLLDTGVRAGELTGFDLADLETVTGTLTVRRGKGGKGRVVFLGQKARRAVRAYLKARGSLAGPLFATPGEERLSYYGLRATIERRAKAAGIAPPPSLHSFRRAFALQMLRAGADLLTLQRLLGHADLSILRRYVKQNADDLRAVHAQHSPVDNAGW